MIRCPKCSSLKPRDELRCIRCGFASSPAAAHERDAPTDAGCVAAGNAATSIWNPWKIPRRKAESMWGAAARSVRQLSVTRLIALVLTSKLFFLASCTGGMVLGRTAFDPPERGTNVALGRPPDKHMAVIAIVRNGARPAESKLVQVPLGSLEQFKQDNPNFSFLPPLGQGEVIGPAPGARTVYTVTAAGPDRVMVDTKFHEDEHGVQSSYEATEREIRPIHTKTSHDMVDFMIGMTFGFPLAAAFALVGYFFQWLSRRAR